MHASDLELVQADPNQWEMQLFRRRSHLYITNRDSALGLAHQDADWAHFVLG